MIKITFPDLSVKEFENGVTANEIAIPCVSQQRARGIFVTKSFRIVLAETYVLRVYCM